MLKLGCFLVTEVVVCSLALSSCEITPEEPDTPSETITVRIDNVLFQCTLTVKVSVFQTINVPVPGTVRQVDIQSARLVNNKIDASDPNLRGIDFSRKVRIVIEFIYVGPGCPADIRPKGSRAFEGVLKDEGGGLYSVPWSQFH
jgi:hypothetical protein